MMSPEKALRLRVGLVYGSLVVFAIAIAVRMFSIQIGEGAK